MVAPANSTGTLQVTAAGYGYSMLSPKISLYHADGTLIDTEANPWMFNTNAVADATGVKPGEHYYVAVTGATGDAFSVGSFGLHVDFSTNPVTSPPTVTQSPAPPFNASPTQGVAVPSNESFGAATSFGVISVANLADLSLNSGSATAFFNFRNASAGVYLISAGGTQVQILSAFGKVLATGRNQVSLRINRPRALVFVEVSSADGNPVSNFELGIATTAPAPAIAVRRRKSRETVTVKPVVPPPSLPVFPHWSRPRSVVHGSSWSHSGID